MNTTNSQEEPKASGATVAERIKRVLRIRGKREEESRQQIADEELLSEMLEKKQSLETRLVVQRSMLAENRNLLRLEGKAFDGVETNWRETASRYKRGIAQLEGEVRQLEGELKEVAKLLGE